jgi:hypothetical protein
MGWWFRATSACGRKRIDDNILFKFSGTKLVRWVSLEYQFQYPRKKSRSPINWPCTWNIHNFSRLTGLMSRHSQSLSSNSYVLSLVGILHCVFIGDNDMVVHYIIYALIFFFQQQQTYINLISLAIVWLCFVHPDWFCTGPYNWYFIFDFQI